MFGFEDKRTPEERQRDLEAQQKRQSDEVLAFGFLNCLKRLIDQQPEDDVATGLVGGGSYGGAELIVESDGVQYVLSAKVGKFQP